MGEESERFERCIRDAKYLGAVRVFAWLEDVIGHDPAWMLRRRYQAETRTPFEKVDANAAAWAAAARVLKEKSNWSLERAEDVASAMMEAMGK
jgi:hypothetical protein